MRLDNRLLGWGIFFIVAGAIPLSVRAGLLDPGVVSEWASLWPVLLIAWGLGLLLRRTPLEWIGGGLAAITFGIMAGGALATGFSGVPGMTGCGGDAGGQAFAAQRGSLGATGQLNVEFSCGTFAATAVDGSEWSVEGSAPEGRAPRVTTSGTGVSIETDGGGSPFDGGETTWNLRVPRAPELGFGLTLNAGRATADLAGASLASANLTVNAGSATLDLAGAAQLGDVNGTVNFGEGNIALPAGSHDVNLSLNAGSMTVCIPVGAAVRVQWSGTLGSDDLEDSGLTEVGDDTWVSAGFSESAAHLELHVSANAGSFALDPGGSCDA